MYNDIIINTYLCIVQLIIIHSFLLIKKYIFKDKFLIIQKYEPKSVNIYTFIEES